MAFDDVDDDAIICSISSIYRGKREGGMRGARQEASDSDRVCRMSRPTDARQDGRTCLARLNSLARTGTGKITFFLSHERDWQPDVVGSYLRRQHPLLELR